MEVGNVFEHSPIFILAEDGEVYQLPLIDDTRNNILTILCAKGKVSASIFSHCGENASIDHKTSFCSVDKSW